MGATSLRSYEGVYFLCTRPPVHDGIMTDPRDLVPCPGCCRPVRRGARSQRNSSESLTALLQPGGYYKPTRCTSLEQLAVIVPYRNREKHLRIFLNHMHMFLQVQQLEYVIYIVELALPTKFNRGLLVNIGVKIAMQSETKFSCFVIHDVDLLPVDARNLYVCSSHPRHMSTINNKFKNDTLPYYNYAGGVISFSAEQYVSINGFSNNFFGWGGEDDDIRRRIWQAGYDLHRVRFDIGRYHALDHGQDTGNPINPYRSELLELSKDKMSSDGLNSVKYKLLAMEKRALYTWIYVEVNESDFTIIFSSSFSLSSSLWKLSLLFLVTKLTL